MHGVISILKNYRPPLQVYYRNGPNVCWLKAGVFEAVVHDLRVLLRLAAGRPEQPKAAIFDSRTLLSSSESGGSLENARVKIAASERVNLFRSIPVQSRIHALYPPTKNAHKGERLRGIPAALHSQRPTHRSSMFCCDRRPSCACRSPGVLPYFYSYHSKFLLLALLPQIYIDIKTDDYYTR